MFADLILQIGRPSYSRSLFQLMRSRLGIRQMAVYRYRPDLSIQPVAAESEGEDRQLQRSLERYTQHFHLRDPLSPLFSPAKEREVLLRCVDAEGIPDREFRNELYLDAGMAGKLMLIIRRPNDALSLSLFRGRERGPFGRSERSFVGMWSRTLAATLERHLSFTEVEAPGALDDLLARCSRLPASTPLSERELAVCARTLRGMTADGIAADLALSHHSVTTYRRRTYAKLGIGSHSQLFALALRDGAAG